MRLLTAGESHGASMTGIIEGLPAGLVVDEDFINTQLLFRSGAAGRSERQRLEDDRITITAGVDLCVTTGAPLCFGIANKCREAGEPLYNVRPGHADLPGLLKYGFDNARQVAERASARETALRTAAGAIAQLLLKEIFVYVTGYVTQLGSVKCSEVAREKRAAAKRSRYRCGAGDEAALEGAIADAAMQGDSLGGKVEVVVNGLPAGYGSYAFYDRRLDARLAFAVMSVPAVKAVEIGAGVGFAELSGCAAADGISLFMGKTVRHSNNSGGIDGGISNGEEVVVRATVKPVPTVQKAVPTISVKDKLNTSVVYERADVCAVPAAAAVIENAVAFEIARVVLEELGGDTVDEFVTRFLLKRERVCCLPK